MYFGVTFKANCKKKVCILSFLDCCALWCDELYIALQPQRDQYQSFTFFLTHPDE